MKIIDETTDYCEFMKGESVGVLFKVVYSLVENNIKFPNGCPFKKVKLI